MSNKAWVTLVTNDTYALGALVLAHSLKKVNTAHKLVVLVSSNVTFAMRGTLQTMYDEVKEVNILDSADTENLRLLARPELGITFTKLHCWKLTQYEKCVFLDADTLVLQNCDELFEREELSAAPDVGWPDCFNSGVFVFKPSEATFKALYDFAITHGSFDGGDQGLLNMYFSDWATSDASKRLPFLYNLSSAAIYSYLPAFKWYGRGVKIVHFIGNSKPWLQPFNSVTRSVEAAQGSSHLQNFLQYWWDLFCACVHPQLSPEMTRLLLRSWYTPQITIKNNPSRNNPMRNEVHIPEPFVAPETEEHFIFTDPWEEFEKNIATSVLEPSNNICVTGCSYNETVHVQNYNNDNQHCNFNSYEDQCTTNNDYHPINKCASFAPAACEPKRIEIETVPDRCQNSIEVYSVPISHRQIDYSDCDNHNSSCNNNYYQCTNDCDTEQSNVNEENCINDQVDCVQNQFISCDNPVNNYSSLHSLTNEILREGNSYSETNKEIDVDAGLANSLSQMKLDEPTPEQKAREDFIRKQNWEYGNVDYLGKDSFNNIWEKISQTMNFEPEAPSGTEKAAPAAQPVAAPPSSVPPTVPESSSVPEVCPKPTPPVQPAEQPASCPKPPTSAQPAEQPVSCPRPPARSQSTEQPPSCPKPASAEPAQQPLVCPKPTQPAPTTPAAVTAPVAESPVAPTPSKPAVEPVSAPPASVPVSPPVVAAPTAQVPAAAAEKAAASVPQTSPVCQKPAPPQAESQAKSSQEVKSAPAQDPSKDATAAPEKPASSKKK